MQFEKTDFGEYAEKIVSAGGLFLRCLPVVGNAILLIENNRLKGAAYDTLTGVFTAERFESEAKKEIRRLGRTKGKSERDLSVAIMDIDNFRAINNMKGHLAGDRTLKEFGHLVNNSVRTKETDTFARKENKYSTGMFGRRGNAADEFLLLFTETSYEDAEKVCNRIVQLIANHKFNAFNRKGEVTASIGYTSFDKTFPNKDEILYDISKPGSEHKVKYVFDTMMEHADKGLYAAKARGKNQACGYDGYRPKLSNLEGALVYA